MPLFLREGLLSMIIVKNNTNIINPALDWVANIEIVLIIKNNEDDIKRYLSNKL